MDILDRIAWTNVARQTGRDLVNPASRGLDLLVHAQVWQNTLEHGWVLLTPPPGGSTNFDQCHQSDPKHAWFLHQMTKNLNVRAKMRIFHKSPKNSLKIEMFCLLPFRKNFWKFKFRLPILDPSHKLKRFWALSKLPTFFSSILNDIRPFWHTFPWLAN